MCVIEYILWKFRVACKSFMCPVTDRCVGDENFGISRTSGQKRFVYEIYCVFGDFGNYLCLIMRNFVILQVCSMWVPEMWIRNLFLSRILRCNITVILWTFQDLNWIFRRRRIMELLFFQFYIFLLEFGHIWRIFLASRFCRHYK